MKKEGKVRDEILYVILTGIVMILVFGIIAYVYQKYYMDELKLNKEEYVCDVDFYNCNEFETRNEAQRVYDYCKRVNSENPDIHRMDSNRDGIVCEALE
jgi:hypothetical protein